MRIDGRFALEGKERVFETFDSNIRCTNCLSLVEDGDKAYICQLKKDVYCKCWTYIDSPACKNTLIMGISRDHSDVFCKIKKLK